jgi:superfamily II DNA or RNA helicase
MDFIKNKDFENDLLSCSWDAVIFDEAHRLRRDASSSTLAYNMAEIIAYKTKSLLLLSATPFRGKLEELYYLIALIDKNILGPYQSFYNEYCAEGADLSTLRRKLDQAVIRRTKRDVGGFTGRHARTIRFDLYYDERFLYDETTKYVAEEFNRALQSENRAVGFVMTVFQKLLDSSSHALLCALRNRLAKLREMLDRARRNNEAVIEFNNSIFDNDSFSDDEELSEADALCVKKTIEELEFEITTISRLVDIASKIEVNKKGEKLIKLIGDLKRKGHKKFLIFTQFRTTQDYLYSILHDFDAVVFNGSMNRDRKEEAILRFKEEAEIIIATEAGGEGRNMQFCDILINYDLPWSPLKIEQRIGRIHRFGQPNDVHIYNFSTRGTVAERVLEVLTAKLKLFEESIGTPDIMLGQVEDEINLNNLFMEMATGRKKKKDVDEELARRIEYARQSFEKLTELTVTDRMDFNYDEYYKVTLKDRVFTNRRIEGFINRFMAESRFADDLMGAQNKKTGLYRIFTGEEGLRYGTFDSEKALENERLDFLAFGHPAVDAIIDHCCSGNFGGETGILFVKSEIPFSGMVFNYLVTFTGISEIREVFTVIAAADNSVPEYYLRETGESLTDQEFFYPDKFYCDDLVYSIIGEREQYFSRARDILLKRVNDRIFDLTEDMEIHIDPELDKIRESYTKLIKELEDKLDLQEGQMKWYGRDMKSAITRTKNSIRKARVEMDSLIKEYSGYSGVTRRISLINSGVIIAE